MMMVFGDVQFRERLDALTERLCATIARTHLDSVDDLRTLLIQCGQLEQAVSDSPELPSASRIHFQRLTDHAARAFLSRFGSQTSELNSNSFQAAAEVNAIRDLLRQNNFVNPELVVKVPEGYEFYALFPEQYVLSVARWRAEHRHAKSVLVIGIRSIGTSLSAVVAAALENFGPRTTRITVRPTGHPFSRTAEFSERDCGAFEHALVVDEGPGISGSSMAAVAEAVSSRGIHRANISFFSGHKNLPGPAASAEAQKWWRETKRYFTPLDDVRWNGKSLREILLAKAAEISRASCSEIQNLSNGGWRQIAYANQTEWPAVNLPFARQKFLCVTSSGREIFWKFGGLGSFYATREIFSERKYVLPELGRVSGFVATTWVEGARLQASDPRPAMLETLAIYLSQPLTPILSAREIETGLERLAQMARHNIYEIFGADELQPVESSFEIAREFFRNNPESATCRSYFDGHLAPHEWIRDLRGILCKSDESGHDTDHTLIGTQPILWDIGGAIIEWKLCGNKTEQFLAELEKRNLSIDSGALQFFLLSYAAFRAGQTRLCIEMLGPDHSEKERLLRATRFYECELRTKFNGTRQYRSNEAPALQNR